MKFVTAKEARQHFAELIGEVYFGNTPIVITRSGKPMVMLSRVTEETVKSFQKKKT